MKSHPPRLASSLEPHGNRAPVGKWLLLTLPVLLCVGLQILARELSAGPQLPLPGVLPYLVDSIGDGGQVGSSEFCNDGTGHCTLRAAIQVANIHPGPDGITIQLPVGSTINLTRALPDLIEGVNITGPGADKLTVRRLLGGNYRIFTVTAASGEVSFSGMTISNGSVNGDVGGAILNTNLATINLTNCTLSGNSADDGGGIFNVGGELRVTHCTLSGNMVSREGGAINSQSGLTSITNCTFSGNSALGKGGAIFNARDSTLNASNSTLSGNSSGLSGGGIHTAGPTHVKSSIIALNTARGIGQDVFNEIGSGVELITSRGFNLIGKNGGAETSFPAGGPNANNDIVGGDFSPVDPKLSPAGLQYNGGHTKTIALLAGSRAIDKGTSFGLTGSLATDQRGTGFTRTMDYPAIANAGGNGTDIGAFEFRGIAPPICDFNRDGSTDYLLANPTTQATAIWNLQGNIFVSGIFGPSLPAGWVLACEADVNLDSKPDYVLFDPSTRRTAVWFLNDNTLVSSSYGPTLPAGWTPIAAADVNRDAHSDYVLFNPSTRQTAVWFLDGTALVGTAFGPTLPAGWVLIGALDFNSDGRPDFLLSDPSTGETAVWYLIGTSRTSSAFGPGLPVGWTLEGAADFNSDGKPDYVLFEASTRRTAFWYLNGVIFTSSAYGPTLPVNYKIASP